MAAWIYVAIFLVSLDRLIKVGVSKYLVDSEINIIGEILKITYATNKYIAFSLPFTGSILVVLIAVIIIILLLAIFLSVKAELISRAGLLTIVAAGAMSNLYDRLVYGAVIDYIDLKYFTVFNIADIMIVGGATSLLFFINTKRSSM
jgi:signal peptidase II